MSAAICLAAARTVMYPHAGVHLWAYLRRAYRRPAFVDTDAGLQQMWMTRGNVQVASQHLYIPIGETVGTSAPRCTDCGLRWLSTPPPVRLPAWPKVSVDSTAPYTTVTHWWGSR